MRFSTLRVAELAYTWQDCNGPARGKFNLTFLIIIKCHAESNDSCFEYLIQALIQKRHQDHDGRKAHRVCEVCMSLQLVHDKYVEKVLSALVYLLILLINFAQTEACQDISTSSEVG